MKPLARFSPMRARGPIRVIPPLPMLEPMRTVDDMREKDDARFKYWVSQVGEDRALIAKALFDERTGSTTLPELLTENYLRSHGARYVCQLSLGFARPDFTVFNSPAAPEGALIIRVAGDHWHGSSDAVARDSAQKDLLMQGTAQGSPIIKVIDVWESSLYRGDTALDLAYFSGEEMPRGA